MPSTSRWTLGAVAVCAVAVLLSGFAQRASGLHCRWPKGRVLAGVQCACRPQARPRAGPWKVFHIVNQLRRLLYVSVLALHDFCASRTKRRCLRRFKARRSAYSCVSCSRRCWLKDTTVELSRARLLFGKHCAPARRLPPVTACRRPAGGQPCTSLVPCSALADPICDAAQAAGGMA